MKPAHYKFSVISILVLFIFGIYFFQKLKAPFSYTKTNAEEVTLVDGFPSVPVYPNSNLIESTKTPKELDYSYSSTWNTNDSVPLVSAWFIQNLAAHGKQITQYPADLKDPDVQLIVIDTTDRIMNISIIADHEKGNTKIVVEEYKFDVEDEEES